jgi:hypothetical protein
MNSETLQEINQQELVKQKLNDIEEHTLQKANVLQDFDQHKGWLILVNELQEFKNKLQTELANQSICDNLTKIRTRQTLISAIDLFIQTPKKFVMMKSNILNRRHKWQTKV